jgi:anti-sigma regulatory factor (Ser/Thr protein kinase)
MNEAFPRADVRTAPRSEPEKRTYVRVFPVRGIGDVIVVRKQAQRLAQEFGLGARRSTELAIVVSELATNIVKYGVRGEMDLILDSGSEPRPEFTVVARDIGPPIRNMEMAMLDGHDDVGPIDPAVFLGRGGLGTGLGAVARLTDRFECQQDDSGKTITVKFFR